MVSGSNGARTVAEGGNLFLLSRPKVKKGEVKTLQKRRNFRRREKNPGRGSAKSQKGNKGRGLILMGQ